MCKTLLIAAVCCCSAPTPALASVASQAAKAITRKLAGEAAEKAVKKTAQQLGVAAAKKAAQEAGEAAARRTASVAARTFGKAAATSPRFADDFAAAAAKLSARNNRRLLIMAPALEESGKAAGVVAQLAQGNADELIETLWKHRAKIGGAAAVTALVVHGDDLVKAGGEYVAKPVIDGTMENVVAPASRLFVSGVILTALIGMVCLAAYLFGGEATERVTANIRGLLNLFSRRR
jgi:hypothetical protein